MQIPDSKTLDSLTKMPITVIVTLTLCGVVAWDKYQDQISSAEAVRFLKVISDNDIENKETFRRFMEAVEALAKAKKQSDLQPDC